MHPAIATPNQQSARSRWQPFWLSFGLLALLSILWALASPLMSVPDESAHAVRAAAVARGDYVGTRSAEFPSQIEVSVPRYVEHTHALACFAFDPRISAACQEDVTGDPDALVATATSAGVNSPLFYTLVGLPTLLWSGDAALYGMRIVNAVLCSALLGLMVMSLRQLGSSRWTMLAVAVAVTPMVLFLMGSINPNSMEMAAAGALFAALVLMLSRPSPGRLLWERALIVSVGALFLSNTRSISLLWVILAVGGAFLLARADIVRNLLRRPATWAAVAASGAAALFALWWYLRPQFTSPPEALPGGGISARLGFEIMIDKTFDNLQGIIGIFGWIDRPAPTIAYQIWTVALGILVVAALALARPRDRWPVILFSSAMVFVPAIAQALIVTDLGIIWQGRYMLAMFVCLVIASGMALDQRFPESLPVAVSRLFSVALGALAFGHLTTFVWVLRRYVIGAGSWVNMVRDATWQPPLTWIGLTILFGSTLGAGAWLLWRDNERQNRAAESRPTPQLDLTR